MKPPIQTVTSRKPSNLRSWYVRNEVGESFGPYLWAEIVDFTEEGRITYSSSVKCPFQTEDQWVNASHVNALKRYFVSAPSRPQPHSANQSVDFFSPPAASDLEIDLLAAGSHSQDSTILERRKPKGGGTISMFLQIAFGAVLSLILYLTVLREHVIPTLQEKVSEYLNKPAILVDPAQPANAPTKKKGE